jgi:HK97 family phage major capsid protein
MTIASPVAEASLKAENALSLTTVSARVKTIATRIPASRQIMDDLSDLAAFIDGSLRYYTNDAEEIQLLSSDNVGEDLAGLIPAATAFSPGFLSGFSGWNKIDVIGAAIQQITAMKELAPSFLVLHPTDWWSIRLLKDGFGRYILGDPQQGALASVGFGSVNPTQNIFGLAVVPTTNIIQGTFLVGSGNSSRLRSGTGWN